MSNGTLVRTLPLLVAGIFSGQKQQFLDDLATTMSNGNMQHHTVIIDAGSSRSRLLAYKFEVPFRRLGSDHMSLVEEYFCESKLGLSSFADDPAKGAEEIVQLIKKADFFTPLEKRKDTPLLVRVTADLQHLPKEKAQSLMNHVSRAVNQLGYSTDSRVQIMDRSDESIFNWQTVNLLLDVMDGATAAVLELRDESSQITYQLSEHNERNYPYVDQYISPAQKDILYTHKYLKLGLLSTRYGIFRLEAADNVTNEVTSACVHPTVQREPWIYGNHHYVVSGLQYKDLRPKKVYKRCFKLVHQYVMQTMDWEQKTRPYGFITAIGYFYDIALDAGLIDATKGGTVSVANFRSTALTTCSGSNEKKPWACMDLVLTIVLLQNVYKIQDHDSITLLKKVDGHEVSWALGLAYSTVMNRIANSA